MRRLLIAVAVGMLAMAGSAEASLVLTIDDLGTAGIDVIVVDNVDGGVGSATALGASNQADSSAVDGMVMFSGAVGSFYINMTTGTSFPVIGNNHHMARLLLNSFTVSGGAGTLELKLTDTDFHLTSPQNHDTFYHIISGWTDGTVEFYGGLDVDNTEFGLGGDGNDVESSLGPYSGNFAHTNQVEFPLGLITGDFSMTTTALVTHDGSNPNEITNFSAEVRVPEPATIVIWSLLGALGVAVAWWRRR